MKWSNSCTTKSEGYEAGRTQYYATIRGKLGPGLSLGLESTVWVLSQFYLTDI